MPTPSRTSLAAIVAAGRDVLEDSGLPGLTMNAVAQRVGVKSPSLYKHVQDRDALVELVSVSAVEELGRDVSAVEDARSLAHAVRSWAKRNPEAFGLAFSSHVPQEIAAAASAPILRVAADLAGENDALAAARLLTAWCSGFISMELAGAFRLGGNVDESFDYALDRLVHAIAPR